MADACHGRRVLVEIPEPQPKIAGHVRRSYLDILSPRAGPSTYSPSPVSRRASRSVPSARRQWEEESDSRGEEVEKSQRSLSNQQLVQLLSTLILLKQKQDRAGPASNLKVLLEDLVQKKANVYRSIPYSRLGSNRDAHCYRKAYPHLRAFKRSCQEAGQLLLESGQWAAAVEYTLVGWRYASELPQWETSSHNAIREHCFHTLAKHCTSAIRHHRPTTSRAKELLKRLKTTPRQSLLVSRRIEELEQLLMDVKPCTPNDSV
ncbi:uncharacterized protein LOC114791101 [Denticeps clupeoides]|uniref:uncharacterized protein LOC114791101 n=1 Tax=Denticeps clupeoides TaxID=299321 RepID=UPI0010A39C7B|nr:uncharacterized protein LOC114791101 [Denticeps clupeoides]